MLKIKDDVDLRELKKFGFKQVRNGIKPMKRWFNDKKPGEYIIISDDTNYHRRRLCSADWEINNNLDTLYDLIIAGLVVKTDE